MEPVAPETESQHLGGQPKFSKFPGFRKLGEWLRQLRLAAGLSQDEIARAIERSKPYVSYVENYTRGRRVPLEIVDAWVLACGHVWEMRFNPIRNEK